VHCAAVSAQALCERKSKSKHVRQLYGTVVTDFGDFALMTVFCRKYVTAAEMLPGAEVCDVFAK
jgi:hypothetical protein